MQVLQTLDPGTPLHSVGDVLVQLLASSLHRRRRSLLLKSLHRAQQLAVRCEAAEVQAGHVAVTETTTCRSCGRLLGSYIFRRCVDARLSSLLRRCSGWC
jgi:hypothetical protein